MDRSEFECLLGSDTVEDGYDRITFSNQIGILLNPSQAPTDVQLDLQQERRLLLHAYRRLRVRMESVHYVLPQDMLQDLTATRDSLTSCVLDAPDTFRSVLSDLFDFLQQISAMLDNRDARGLETPGRKRARPSTSSDQPGGSAGSDSWMPAAAQQPRLPS